MFFEAFYHRRLEIAAKLDSGCIGGSYLEGTLILASVISSLASLYYPGDGIDRKRFAEILIRHSNHFPGGDTVSVPSLHEKLSQTDSIRLEKLEKLRPKLRNWNGGILTSGDIDLPESTLSSLNLPIQELRKHSYASRLYKEIRCGLVHEYDLGAKAEARPVTRLKVPVSYSNVITDDLRTIHPIIFRFSWIHQHVSSLIDNLSRVSKPFGSPSLWWCDGG